MTGPVYKAIYVATLAISAIVFTAQNRSDGYAIYSVVTSHHNINLKLTASPASCPAKTSSLQERVIPAVLSSSWMKLSSQI